MVAGAVIEVTGLTKRFGTVAAVNDLSFTVQPGRVTGFLGPNGAGKTTTLRTILGLVRATSGTATIGGTPYRKLSDPLRNVGAALEASSFHPGRTARAHLAVYAAAARLPRERIDAVLQQVGLADFAHRRVGGYSLGMRGRLNLAFTLLGDPGVLILDEPINGLDPEGIRWIREFLRGLAAEGRTVLVSSHLLSEVQQSVDDVVIIAHGRLVHAGPIASLETEAAAQVIADSPDRDGLAAALSAAGLSFTQGRTGLLISDAEPGEVGHIAFAAGIELSLLNRKRHGIEDSFLAMVASADEGGH